MIALQYDKTITVKRMVEDESGIGEEYVEFLTAIPCHIQPLDETFSTDLDGSFGKNSLMFCDVSDILEGDRIIEGANEYRVVGVESFHFLGADRHMELTIRKFIS